MTRIISDTATQSRVSLERLHEGLHVETNYTNVTNMITRQPITSHAHNQETR